MLTVFDNIVAKYCWGKLETYIVRIMYCWKVLRSEKVVRKCCREMLLGNVGNLCWEMLGNVKIDRN